MMNHGEFVESHDLFSLDHGRLPHDVGFMQRAIALNGCTIQVAPTLCAQRVHGLCAVRQNGLALKFLSEDKL